MDADALDGDYTNDPDDGHEHEFVEAEIDLSRNDNTVTCTRCGMLSVEDADDIS